MKGTNIDGDVAVGRNVAIGGGVVAQGGATFKGSVNITGWLDAKNIKACSKGLFVTIDELIEEYPKPEKGWFAIVLDESDKTMGFLYTVENEEWVKTLDTAQPYNFIIDSINAFVTRNEYELQVRNFSEEQKDLSDAINEVANKQNNLEGDVEDIAGKQELLTKNIETIAEEQRNIVKALENGELTVGKSTIADGVKKGSITPEMLNVSLRTSLDVVDSLDDNNPKKPLSARQGSLLKQMINALDGSDTSLEEFTDFLSSIENDITALDGKIAALSAGLKLTLTASPSVIHKGVKTTITLKGSVADNAGAVTADRMVVVTSAGEVAQDNVSSLTATDEITTNNSSVQFSASALYNGISLSAKATVSARYPVYAGMGATPEDIAIGTTYRQAATTTAAGKTYSATAKADNVYFFLLVPTEVSQPSSFYMGGSPFTMNPAYTKRIGVVEFKIYQSGSDYDTGASVNVKTE